MHLETGVWREWGDLTLPVPYCPFLLPKVHGTKIPDPNNDYDLEIPAGNNEFLRIAQPETVRANGEILTDEALQQAFQEAISRWQQSGVEVSGLGNLTITGGALDDDLLGVAEENLITIDMDAAGYGWYFDDDYSTDNEFQTDDIAGVDLLTAVMHEIGHELGVEHSSDETGHSQLMSPTLGVGERLNPDGFFANHYNSFGSAPVTRGSDNSIFERLTNSIFERLFGDRQTAW